MFVLHGQFHIVSFLLGADSFQILNSHLQQSKTNVNCAQYDSRLTHTVFHYRVSSMISHIFLSNSVYTALTFVYTALTLLPLVYLLATVSMTVLSTVSN